jgi:hypothetical protein
VARAGGGEGGRFSSVSRNSRRVLLVMHFRIRI